MLGLSAMAQEKISLEQVRHVARLARLELAPAEEQRLQVEMSEMLGYVDKLNELDTEAVEPTA
ncbi:MAG: Asp-tRNA(Asn)/Glu-tRNA(Gln) amidotransferase subunit GatC, partial [Candidatus Binataceae bacterium]